MVVQYLGTFLKIRGKPYTVVYTRPSQSTLITQIESLNWLQLAPTPAPSPAPPRMARQKRTAGGGGGKKAAEASTAVGARHESVSASTSPVRQPAFSSPSANIQKSAVSRQDYDVAALMRGEDLASSEDDPVVRRAKRTLGMMMKALRDADPGSAAEYRREAEEAAVTVLSEARRAADRTARRWPLETIADEVEAQEQKLKRKKKQELALRRRAKAAAVGFRGHVGALEMASSQGFADPSWSRTRPRAAFRASPPVREGGLVRRAAGAVVRPLVCMVGALRHLYNRFSLQPSCSSSTRPLHEGRVCMIDAMAAAHLVCSWSFGSM